MAQAQTLASTYREELDLPGLAMAIAVRDQVVVSETRGVADLESDGAVVPRDRFRIGSVSKLFTATAAARLAQRGTLDLDAPVSRYIAELPAAYAGVTVRQLAGHLAGIRHYRRDEFISTERFSDVGDSLDRFLSDPPVGQAGEGYFYSSYGYNLLGAVLERAAGKPFQMVIRDEVLIPLGLKETSAETAETKPDVGYYWRNREGAVVAVPHADLSDRWPSGGYLSTARDLARFGVGVLNRDYLSQKTRELMFTSQRTVAGKETQVGLAWRVAVDSKGRRYVHHGGEALGGRAFLLVYPEEQVAVALVTNLSFAPLGEQQALALADLFLE